MSRKTLIIGLDGATFKLLIPWINSGHLKHIGRLIGEGFKGILESTIPWTTIPAWTSFATGKNPGKHGCFDFRLPGDSLGHTRFIDAYDIPGRTFYELLYEVGKKITIINLPPSYPPRIGGTVITSLMTRGSDKVYPAELEQEIPELRNYRIAADDRSIESIRQVEQQRFLCAQKLFERDWDLFFVMFSGSDHISHEFFSEMQNKPSPVGAGKVFVDLDNYIGWFMNHIPPDTNLFVVSDHGFSSIQGMFYVNSWLAREGYLSLGGSVYPDRRNFPISTDIEAIKSGSGSSNRIGAFLYNHPDLFRAGKGLYRRFRRAIPFRPELGSIGIDLQGTSAYAATNECKGIYINDKERFKDGTVNQQDVSALRDILISKLESLRDPKNNQNVFKKVWRKEELFHGPELRMAPDIIFEQQQFVNFLLRASDPFEDVTVNYHDREGILLAYGPDIAWNNSGTVSDIADIAPTVLHLMDFPIPVDMDGKVLRNLLDEHSPAFKKEIVYGPETGSERHFQREIGDEELEIIDERLRALGY